MTGLLILTKSLLFLSTLVSGRFVCHSDGWVVTPSNAYTWSNKPPQGCGCKATGVSLKECEASDGNA